MIVLGIDPGTAALGYGIVERTGGRLRAVDYGVVVTSATDGLPDRLLAIHGHLVDIIELHRPDLLGVERLFFSRNAQTALGVGQARGLVLLAAAQHRIPVREATPNEVKTAVTGHGAADKAQVARMTRVVLGLSEDPAPDDAADALAVAIWAASVADHGPAAEPGRLDLSAVAARPQRAASGYERAVHEALAAERRNGRRAGIPVGPGKASAVNGAHREPAAPVAGDAASDDPAPGDRG